MELLPGIDDIRAAADRIRPFVHRTPVLTCRALDERVGISVFLKCENLQRVGAFKMRGATNAVLSLSEEDAARGVVTHSSGNHAQALALAARNRGIPATVVMPLGAPPVKRRAVIGYGARVVDCEPTLAARESTAARVQAETGATFIHPYDDVRIIAGQGTAALELLEDAGPLDAVLAPVGGGGLLSGTAIVAKSVAPHARVIAAEPAAVDDAYRSFHAGKLLPVGATPTIADGLRTSLCPRTFAAIEQFVDDVLLVDEDEILEATRFVWERAKIVIEPSAAVPVAALIRHRIDGVRRVGVILSGGNVDLDALRW